MVHLVHPGIDRFAMHPAVQPVEPCVERHEIGDIFQHHNPPAGWICVERDDAAGGKKLGGIPKHVCRNCQGDNRDDRLSTKRLPFEPSWLDFARLEKSRNDPGDQSCSQKGGEPEPELIVSSPEVFHYPNSLARLFPRDQKSYAKKPPSKFPASVWVAAASFSGSAPPR